VIDVPPAPPLPPYIPWRFRATVVRVVDGDTFIAEVSLGFYVTTTHSFRLMDYNAPELFSGDDREAGAAARERLLALIPPGTLITLHSDKSRTSFARYVARVTLDDGRDLATVLKEMA